MKPLTKGVENISEADDKVIEDAFNTYAYVIRVSPTVNGLINLLQAMIC